ncbi:tRNA (guanine(37)-N(1))-methyltransferase [Candidatus Saccharibacteria bacterium]|nr:tRNA (guanine(37)-N(1))-methyltransferase [Candidatus Saccharibacteria bacterium]
MKFSIITLFPEMFAPVLDTSMLWKAQEKNLVEFELINLREFGIGPRRQVDDTPYGGGDGMLMKPEPIFAAVEHAKKTNPDAKVILMTPKGTIWSQELARKFATEELAEEDFSRCTYCEKSSSLISYIVICPHYEGYDERILSLVDHQISIGKYILTGGELPAMIVIDSIVRLIPGVLGGETSAEIESFSDGDNLEYPQYTRPETFKDMKVPDVLLSGNHGAIAKWREQNSPKTS